MRVAVTGVNGFVGVHLTRELVEHGHEVVGIGLGGAAPGADGLLADYVEQDLTVAWPTVSCDAVIHLAGLSAVGPSFTDPQKYIERNSAQVTHLGEALLTSPPGPQVVVVSTGAVYASGVGLDESSVTLATSPYAVSKLVVEKQCEYYRVRGLPVTVMRPFNHIGPGQQPGFLLPDLITRLAAGGTLTVGNLDTQRDYTDVRDVVRAYRMVVESRPVAPVINVCSGQSTSGRTLLGLVVEEMGVPSPDIDVDPTRLRPDDPLKITGDNRVIGSLGWAPTIDLRTTVRDTVAATA